MVRAANEKSYGFYVTIGACLIASSLLIYYDLGVLAFVMLVFVAIFGFGLRDKFSNEETASAYSVFNKDGRSIVGGFTASQFERQMRGGLAGSGDDSDNPLKGPIAEHDKGTTGGETVSENERLRRRRAAAEAAQRRLRTSDN